MTYKEAVIKLINKFTNYKIKYKLYDKNHSATIYEINNVKYKVNDYAKTNQKLDEIMNEILEDSSLMSYELEIWNNEDIAINYKAKWNNETQLFKILKAIEGINFCYYSLTATDYVGVVMDQIGGHFDTAEDLRAIIEKEVKKYGY